MSETAGAVERHTVACEVSCGPVHPVPADCATWPGRSTVSNELQRGPPVPCETFRTSGAPLIGADV